MGRKVKRKEDQPSIDVATEDYLVGRGEFSAEADIDFSNYLKELAKAKERVAK